MLQPNVLGFPKLHLWFVQTIYFKEEEEEEEKHL